MNFKIIITLIICFISPLCSYVKKETCCTDLIVIVKTTSRILASFQSAWLSIVTLTVEQIPWLGGMISVQGVSATDGNYHLYSGILKVKPYQWTNLLGFFCESTISTAEFKEGVNVFNKNMNVAYKKSVLIIQKACELISTVKVYIDYEKMESICYSFIGTGFISNHVIQKKELVLQVDSLTNLSERNFNGFDRTYKELQAQICDTL